MDILKLIETFQGVFIADFLRYFLPAGTAFLVFWLILGKKLSHRFIQRQPPPSSKLWFEFKYSMSTVLIFALIGVGIVAAKEYGAFHFYDQLAARGWGYFILSLAIMLVFHDAYFYWTHRWMHHPRIFRYVHKVHHLSTNPTPWAAYSFHPIEAVVQAMVLPIILLFLPVHQLTVFIFLLYMIVRNVWGHLGYELFPKGFIKNQWLNWHTSTTHHSMHHQDSKCNFGLYFTWWDTWMKTTHKRYQDSFKEVTSRPQKLIFKYGPKVAFLLLGLSSIALAQSPQGSWMTFDESSGEPLSIITISKNTGNNSFEGVIDSVIAQPYQSDKWMGLEFAWGFKKNGDEWTGGNILDPESGTTYKSKIWFNSQDEIKVRGYGGPFYLFYRTQLWKLLQGSGIEGLWAVKDDRYHRVRAHVELYTSGNELKGYIKKIFQLPHEGNYPICTECEGELKDKSIVGMQFMTGFIKQGDKWASGVILDPGNGNKYHSDFRLKDANTLVIRGYWGPFYRTQVWKRYI